MCELQAGDYVQRPGDEPGRVVLDVEERHDRDPLGFEDDDPRVYGITYTDGSYEELSGGEYLTVE